ncbi:MAG: hypothetical protein Q9182_002389 [Xanthomendoza sp. 2 TL-2023]
MLLWLHFIGYIFTVLTAQASADGHFLQPWTASRGRRPKDYSDNINYVVGTQVITQWTADFSNASIDLVQDNHPGSYNKTTWSWKVTYAGLDPTFNNIFYLSVISADGSESFTSHYFNISRAESKSLATAVATSSVSLPSTTPGSQAPPTSQSPPPPPATITVTPPKDGGSTPPSTIAGVVVGTVVGTLFLAGAAWWAWTKSKKKRDDEKMPSVQQPAPPTSSIQPEPQEVDRNQIYELPKTDRERMFELQETGRSRMFELQETGRSRIFELDGSGRAART